MVSKYYYSEDNMPSIFSSRKFWIMVVDTFVSLTAYFVGRYTSPESAKDILFLIGALQPIVLLVVYSITVQNLEAMRADTEPAASEFETK